MHPILRTALFSTYPVLVTVPVTVPKDPLASDTAQDLGRILLVLGIAMWIAAVCFWPMLGAWVGRRRGYPVALGAACGATGPFLGLMYFTISIAISLLERDKSGVVQGIVGMLLWQLTIGLVIQIIAGPLGILVACFLPRGDLRRQYRHSRSPIAPPRVNPPRVPSDPGDPLDFLRG